MLTLRDYQQNAINAVFSDLRENDSSLIVSPTGTGKTVLICGIVKRTFPGRVMILAHREELIFQAKDKIERFTGIECCVEMADLRAKDGMGALWGLSQVVVSSVQTQNAGGVDGRMTRFDPNEFAYLIIDEAHHATAQSYRRVIEWYRKNPNLKVIGVTATPDRADEEALGQVFDSVAFDYEILDAINDGYLVPVKQTMVTVEDLDFSKIETRAGDLNSKQLALVMEEEEALHQIASPTLELAGNRKTLVFATSVAHAERLAEIFKRHRPGSAAWICGKTPKEERRKLLAQYAQGKFQFMVNVGCLTEGFDDPGVELVVIARPTKSRALYAQMIGRGIRPLPDTIDGLDTPADRRAAIKASPKPHCEILDFAGNSGRHKLMTAADILGGKYSDEVIARVAKKTKEQPENAADVAEELKQAEWELAQEKAAREAAERARLKVRASYKKQVVDPFDVLAIQPTRERGWERGKKLSEKQEKLLRDQGIDPDARNFHENKQLLNEIFNRWDQNLCSFKQAKLLQRYGYPTDLGRNEAKQVIDALAKNSWKPVEITEVLSGAVA